MRIFKNNDLIRTFIELKGNPKWSLLTEPLWYIPFSLFSPFATLYMYQLGVSDEQIGLIISIGFFLQAFFAIIGGVITDKLGRRMTTFIFDTISWSVPCLIWAFAQNFWWFLIAAMVNASYQITNTSWNCLFTEDCPPKHLTNAFTLVHIAGMLSIFFSPLAVLLVDQYSVIQVVSVLYFISAISMFMKFLLLFLFGGETEMGKKRMEETKGITYASLLMGYWDVIKSVFRSSRMIFVVLFMAMTNVIQIATGSFFAIYITESLGIPDGEVAWFPIIRTIIMILFVFLLQNVMNRLKMKRSLIIGLFVYALSHVVLLSAPIGSFSVIAVYTILEAISFAIITPRKEALMAFYVENTDRSRIYAIFNASMIAVSAPFGFLIGKLFEYNDRWPFIFNIGLIAALIVLVLVVKAIGSYDRETEAV